MDEGARYTSGSWTADSIDSSVIAFQWLPPDLTPVNRRAKRFDYDLSFNICAPTVPNDLPFKKS